MTSSIPEVETSQRSRKSRKSLIFIVILLFALGLTSGESVLADDSSKVRLNDVTITLTTGTPLQRYSVDNHYYIELPLYMHLSGSFPDYTYITGWYIVDRFVNSGMNFTDSSNTTITPKYFKPIDNTFTMGNLYDSLVSLAFDNFMQPVPQNYNRPTLVGWFVFEFNYNSASTTINVNSNNYTLTSRDNRIYYTNYEFGLVNAIIYALNNASDIDSVLTFLNDIKTNNAGYYNNLMSLLVYMEDDLDNVNTNIDAIYVLLDDYINGAQSGATDASEAAAQVGSQAAQEHAAQESLYALSPGNMNDLDGALNDFGLLDDVKNSTDFWGYCINQFSSRSGPLWGIFIFGLILGLIAFILRLSR